MRRRVKFGLADKPKAAAKPATKRMYQVEWEILKAKNTLVLEAPVEYHYRIIRMLRKEKHTDVEFAFHERETRGMSRLIARSSGTKLTFTLRYTF